MAKRIICVGLVCVDIIGNCNGFPIEDSDHRCEDIWWGRGGNASNSCTVLSLLGSPCDIVGTMAKTHELGYLMNDFKKYDICTDHCVFYDGDGQSPPMAVVMINKENGSRTILWNPGSLPDISFDDFQKIDLTTNKYKWIHFEGRPSVTDIEKMTAHIHTHNQTVPDPQDTIKCSVEIENDKEEYLPLAQTADYVFVSKQAARKLGYTTKEEAVQQFISRCRPGATVICAWGDTGASAKCGDGPTVTSPAFSPDKMMDTCGAGDTFNAATILALSQGCGLEQAITFGCEVAGAKCGMMGFEDLRGKFQVPQPLPKTAKQS